MALHKGIGESSVPKVAIQKLFLPRGEFAGTSDTKGIFLCNVDVRESIELRLLLRLNVIRVD